MAVHSRLKAADQRLDAVGEALMRLLDALDRRRGDVAARLLANGGPDVHLTEPD
ncbi:MAG: hypothetical protein J2P22_15740 [Nocardioides sp.]|nr:hypothetical protein [Nocardioides sp.]